MFLVVQKLRWRSGRENRENTWLVLSFRDEEMLTRYEHESRIKKAYRYELEKLCGCQRLKSPLNKDIIQKYRISSGTDETYDTRVVAFNIRCSATELRSTQDVLSEPMINSTLAQLLSPHAATESNVEFLKLE